MTDEVTVQSATIVDYAIAATLYTYAGPDKDVVMAKAQEGAQKYIAAMKRLGRDITISGVHAAIHVAGVQRAVVTSPAVDVITIADTEAGNCTGIALAWGGEAE
jgi:phage-related baseplate assembly protein